MAITNEERAASLPMRLAAQVDAERRRELTYLTNHIMVQRAEERAEKEEEEDNA